MATTKENKNFKTLNVGFNHFIPLDRLIAVVEPESAAVKKIIKTAKETNKLINAASGRKTKSVLIMDTGQVILASIAVSTLSQRVV
eukprot:COSAG01_NODE_52_length_31456_cov_125.226648_12_plen_86_part_00